MMEGACCTTAAAIIAHAAIGGDCILVRHDDECERNPLPNGNKVDDLARRKEAGEIVGRIQRMLIDADYDRGAALMAPLDEAKTIFARMVRREIGSARTKADLREVRRILASCN